MATLMAVIDMRKVTFRGEVILFNIRKAAPGLLPVSRSGKAPRCFVICVSNAPGVIPPLSVGTQTGRKPPVTGSGMTLEAMEIQLRASVDFLSVFLSRSMRISHQVLFNAK